LDTFAATFEQYWADPSFEEYVPARDHDRLDRALAAEVGSRPRARLQDQSPPTDPVAATVGLGTPGAARRLYSAVVRPHTESVLEGRSSESKVTPVHLGKANLATIREAIAGRTIVVQRG